MNKIAFDTARMSLISLILQGMGLLLNILLTNTLGTVAVGVMTLITTIFGFIIVLANGNIFVSTNRFVSEEIGAGNFNFSCIMRLSLTFSLTLSCFFAVMSFLFADKLALLSGDPNIGVSVRLLALSLPPAGVGSCIKGFFHAKRVVRIPLIGDITEFAIKWLILMSGILFFVKNGVSVYLLIAVSILLSEIVSCTFFLMKYIAEYKKFSKVSGCRARIKDFKSYIMLNFPIIASGYVTMTMSGLNDALVPVALLEYHKNSDAAMSEYGLFESIIIPAVFFPSVVLNSLHILIIPEIARANSAGDSKRVKHLIYKIFKKTMSYSLIIAGVLLACGDGIGRILSPANPLVSDTLTKMFFIVPFIYMEIVLEGILKGLGKQGFSTVNSFIEYVIRIAAVIVCVNFWGFTGVLVSYYASNIFSNILRVIVVCKTAKVRFDWADFFIVPLTCVFFAAVCGVGLSNLFFGITNFSNMKTIGFICIMGIVFLLLHSFDEKFLSSEDYCVNGNTKPFVSRANKLSAPLSPEANL
ncbi:MAG: polysaccharide biosynthesis C-terminal domain-containing protein [Ruminococcus sp.]|nr:polysaccharide biosynthesis C-terminal domain-containing protein [Ruminococcus sp.]